MTKKIVELIGTKAENLVILDGLCKSSEQEGIAVPIFLPLPHDLCLNHLNKYAPGWQELWQKFVQQHKEHNGDLTQSDLKLLARIRSLIEVTFAIYPLPENITAKITSKLSADDVLMVRSTGKEDTVDLANPGGNLSLAAIPGTNKDISTAVGKVIASYFSEKSLRQRLQADDDITETPFMPVLVQKMIGEHKLTTDPEAVVSSGVMYTSDTTTNINSAFGHGELVVAGDYAYDTFYVSAEDVIYKTVRLKEFRMLPTQIKDKVTGNVKTQIKPVKNPKDLYGQTLPESVIYRLNEFGRHIHKEYGGPMDIEWVYDPKKDVIYIVQARPVPGAALQSKSEPSSVKPESVKDINNKMLGEVISPAANAAQVITEPQQLIIADTIEEALEIYLSLKDPKVKAVIVNRAAAPSSHPAAQFNAMLIPVLRMPAKATTEIKQTLDGDGKFCLVVDVQRRQIFDALKFIDKDNEIPPEQQLFSKETGILSKGLFKSSQTSNVTIGDAPYLKFAAMADQLTALDFSEGINQKLGALLHDIDSNNSEDAIKNVQILLSHYYRLASQNSFKQINSLDDLSEELVVIESAQPHKIEDSEQALTNIIMFLLQLTMKHSEPNNIVTTPIISSEMRQLLREALKMALEIENLLQKIKYDDTMSHGLLRKDLLDLVNKLEGILFNPGNNEIISHSLTQIFAEKKALKTAAALTQENKLDAVAAEFFLQFSKCAQFACNDTLKNQWLSFAVTCAKDKNARQKLAHMVMYFVKTGNIEILVNQIFSQMRTSQQDDISLLNAMFGKVSTAIGKMKDYFIDEIQSQLTKLEGMVPQFASIDKYQQLIITFKAETQSIFNILSKIDWDNLDVIELSILLAKVNSLTEIIDSSIKSLKGSIEYADNKTLQATRFAEMLSVYHDLMQMQVVLIPSTIVQQYRASGDEYTRRDVILNGIRKVFNHACENITEHQLNESGNFSVNSAVISSPACFKRQFLDKEDLTLEDLFTLFHQNILAANVYLSEKLSLDDAVLPVQMQNAKKFFEKNIVYRENVDGMDAKNLPADIKHSPVLLNTSFKYPFLSLQYNIPLAYHGSKFIINWNVHTKRISIEGNIYGHARDRFERISNFLNLYMSLANLETDKGAWYDAKKSILGYDYVLPANTTDAGINDACQIVLEVAGMTFTTYQMRFNKIIDTFERSTNPQAEEKLQQLIKFIAANESSFIINLADIERVLNLFPQKIQAETLATFMNAVGAASNRIFASETGIKLYINIQKAIHGEGYLNFLASDQLTPSESFLECCIRLGNLNMAADLIERADTSKNKHPNALKLLITAPINLTGDNLSPVQLSMAQKLLDKGICSKLSDADESKLEALGADSIAKYKELSAAVPRPNPRFRRKF